MPASSPSGARQPSSLTPAERWQQVKRLLEASLELPVTLRGPYLESACPDTDVRAEVESLLEAHERVSGFLEGPALGERPSLDAMRREQSAGERVGPYRLLKELGRGGTGTVYRAVRDDDEFQILVALKVVSRGMDTDLVLGRFRTERQILANLDHPYIARMLDGGSTEDGRPYLVMEHVEGMPLLEYCNRERLGVADRLRLFRCVCEAVRYAHQSLVVHRDLKPSNILVCRDGTPKLLDFGVAKVLNTVSLDPTATALRMVTPAYASPEQVRGAAVGVTTDVYSLGVVLYELLTGHRPYRLPSQNTDETARIICGREPTRPSAVIGFIEAEGGESDAPTLSPEQIVRERGATLEGLRRQLRGDLDNIVLKALRKEPQRRYASVEEFSEDVRRHLDGLTVLARKDTPLYRVAKFARRRRGSMIAGGVAALLLLCTTGMAVWQASRLRARVNEDRKLASAFLVDIHDAIAKLPGATPARESLLRQSLQYLNGLAADAGDDPGLQRALASAYDNFADLQVGTAGAGLGQAAAALETSLKAQAIRERLVAEHPDDLQAKLELAQTYLLASHILGRVRSVDERTAMDRKALALSEILVKADPNHVAYRSVQARSHTSLAYGLALYDRWAEATQHFRLALGIRQWLVRAEPDNQEARRELARLQYRLGSTNAQSGQHAQALDYLRQSLQVQEPLMAQEPGNQQYRSELAATYHFTGVSLTGTGDLAGAVTVLNRAIAIREADLSRDPRDARSRSLLAGNYAERSTAQLRAADRAGALASIRRSLELQEPLLALDRQGVATRISVADASSRLGAVHASYAESATPPAERLRHWSEAALAYRRAAGLYAELRREGHLRSPAVAADADRAAKEAVRCEQMAAGV